MEVPIGRKWPVSGDFLQSFVARNYAHFAAFQQVDVPLVFPALLPTPGLKRPSTDVSTGWLRADCAGYVTAVRRVPSAKFLGVIDPGLAGRPSGSDRDGLSVALPRLTIAQSAIPRRRLDSPSIQVAHEPPERRQLDGRRVLPHRADDSR
jgi:hypothetical protein